MRTDIPVNKKQTPTVLVINNLTNKKHRKLVIAAGVLLIGALIFAGVQYLKPASTELKAKAPVLTVSSVPVSMKPIERSLTVTGSIWAWDPIQIGSEVTGLRVDSVNVDEGSFVRKGQVLATLNSSILRAQLEREQARLASATASLSKAIQPNRSQDIRGMRASVDQSNAAVAQEVSNVVRAEASLVNAKAVSNRYAQLVSAGAVSAQDAMDRHTAEKVAAADLRTAQERLIAARSSLTQQKERWSLVQEGGRQEDITISRASIDEIKGAVHQIESQIEQTIIRAPDDGFITKRDIHIGETPNISKNLFFSMVRNNRLEVRAQVPESDLPRLTAGQVVDFAAPGLGHEITGKLREISPMIDAETRLATIRIDIPFERGLIPGMFMTGHTHLGAQPAVVVPARSVINRDDRSFVFAIHGDQVHSRTVHCGDRSGDLIEIRDGISVGDIVVDSGAGFLKDGDYVKVSNLLDKK